jgi:ketosteroid isomerase-like protein
MAEGNVELLQHALAAINGRDLDTLLALSDPDIEFTTLLLQIEGGGPYRGHAGLRKWWHDLIDVFPEYRIELDDVRELGDVTVAGVRGIARGEGSDAFFEQRFWQVTEWRDGKGVWWCNYLNEAEAMEAAAGRH